jgi:non-ribosomal peptide synthetase component E (peptide arylation enzyme)
VALLSLLREGVRPPVLLFVQTKEKAQKLCSRVASEGLIAAERIDYVSTQRDAKQVEFIIIIIIIIII